MKRLVLAALAASALAVPVVPAAAYCEDLPVNASCESYDGHCDVYKKPHPRTGRGFCLRLTP